MHLLTHEKKTNMDLSEALAFVCAEHFLQVHPSVLGATKTMDIRLSREQLEPAKVRCASWIAKGAFFFTILKIQNQTVVYCHANKMMYYTSPNIQLPMQIPNGYAFLGQTAIDNGSFPRLLILDIVEPKIPDPMQRGMELRKFTEFFPSTCHVQWSGDLLALRKFLEKGLPHAVDGIVSMHEPLCYTLEKR